MLVEAREETKAMLAWVPWSSRFAGVRNFNAASFAARNGVSLVNLDAKTALDQFMRRAQTRDAAA
jgi:hypothetical protein